ncbi:precursor of CEP6-like [Telopea speciosissima]|uniref:precursor of CEP6-like n=1 Tax=Telopea speciosissima TaxID=54955 RepID=UPI001CC6FEDD|nr:precursor of CEP6-like [Telopea speciosissima]
MGKVEFIFASVLLVFVLSHAIYFIEARHLTEVESRKVGENTNTLGGDHTSKKMAQVANQFKPTAFVHIQGIEAVNPAVPLEDSPSPSPAHIEHFRPTESGNSPGVGHSIHN